MNEHLQTMFRAVGVRESAFQRWILKAIIQDTDSYHSVKQHETSHFSERDIQAHSGSQTIVISQHAEYREYSHFANLPKHTMHLLLQL
jgi:hypothetical protein